MEKDFDLSIQEEEEVNIEQNMKLLKLNDKKPYTKIHYNLNTIRIPPADSITKTNRRYTLRPQKRPENTDCDEMTPAKRSCVPLRRKGYLETIFENPIPKNGSLMLLGKQKCKRFISFNDFVTKAKFKHRKTKVKRLLSSKIKKRKIMSEYTVDDVRRKLKSLEDSINEDDEWMDIKD